MSQTGFQELKIEDKIQFQQAFLAIFYLNLFHIMFDDLRTFNRIQCNKSQIKSCNKSISYICLDDSVNVPHDCACIYSLASMYLCWNLFFSVDAIDLALLVFEGWTKIICIHNSCNLLWFSFYPIETHVSRKDVHRNNSIVIQYENNRSLLFHWPMLYIFQMLLLPMRVKIPMWAFYLLQQLDRLI